MVVVLFESDLAIVTREPGFIRARRKSLAFGTGDAAKASIDEHVTRFRVAVPLRDRKASGLLIDTRDAPLAASDDTQNPLRPLLQEMMREFPRVSILMQTAIGLLQASRRTREASGFGHPSLALFTDEAAAIAYLRGEEPAVSSKYPTHATGKTSSR